MKSVETSQHLLYSNAQTSSLDSSGMKIITGVLSPNEVDGNKTGRVCAAVTLDLPTVYIPMKAGRGN